MPSKKGAHVDHGCPEIDDSLRSMKRLLSRLDRCIIHEDYQEALSLVGMLYAEGAILSRAYMSSLMALDAGKMLLAMKESSPSA